jgi:hypothetical protein
MTDERYGNCSYDVSVLNGGRALLDLLPRDSPHLKTSHSSRFTHGSLHSLEKSPIARFAPRGMHTTRLGKDLYVEESPLQFLSIFQQEIGILPEQSILDILSRSIMSLTLSIHV